MKINNNGNNEALKAYGAAAPERQQRAFDSGESQKSSSSIEDKIHISSKVKMFQDIKQAAMDAPDIRMDKVKDIEQKISQGTYSPDYNAIADKLLSQNISSRI